MQLIAFKNKYFIARKCDDYVNGEVQAKRTHRKAFQRALLIIFSRSRKMQNQKANQNTISVADAAARPRDAPFGLPSSIDFFSGIGFRVLGQQLLAFF